MAVDVFHGVVGTVSEESLDEIGRGVEPVGVRIAAHLLVNLGQLLPVGRIVGVADDDFLAEDMTLEPQSEQLHEEVAVEVDVEHHRIVVGLVGDKHGQGDEDGRGEALAEPDGPDALARHSVARVVENVVDDEHKHGDDDRDAQSALADDGSQWGADEEEDEAGEGHRELVDGLYLVLPQYLVGILGHHGLELQVVGFRLDGGEGRGHSIALLVEGEPVVEGVDVDRPVLRHAGLSDAVGGLDARRAVIEHLGLLVEGAADGVVDLRERVDVVVDFVQSLSPRIVAQAGGVGHVEVAVVVEHDLLLQESLALVGHGGAGGELRALHVLKPFSAPQGEQQVLLLGCGLEHSRVGEDDGLVLVGACHPIYHDAVELARLGVLLLHVDVAVGDSVVEYTFGNLQLGALLLHGDEQLHDFHVGVGTDVVLEVERTQHDADGEDDERSERLQE